MARPIVAIIVASLLVLLLGPVQGWRVKPTKRKRGKAASGDPVASYASTRGQAAGKPVDSQSRRIEDVPVAELAVGVARGDATSSYDDVAGDETEGAGLARPAAATAEAVGAGEQEQALQAQAIAVGGGASSKLAAVAEAPRTQTVAVDRDPSAEQLTEEDPSLAGPGPGVVSSAAEAAGEEGVDKEEDEEVAEVGLHSGLGRAEGAPRHSEATQAARPSAGGAEPADFAGQSSRLADIAEVGRSLAGWSSNASQTLEAVAAAAWEGNASAAALPGGLCPQNEQAKGKRIGCATNCSCLWYHRCYPMHMRREDDNGGTVVDMGVCELGVVAMMLASIGLFVGLLLCVFIFRLCVAVHNAGLNRLSQQGQNREQLRRGNSSFSVSGSTKAGSIQDPNQFQR